jgi:threonine-phosphate decarboxylase
MKDVHGGDIWKASAEAGVAPETLIDFSSSINPLGPPPGARAAIRGAFRDISAYPEPSQASLREAIADRHGLRVSEVLPANGSTELIYLIPRVLSPRRALIVEPAFSEYARPLACSGASVEALTLREEDGFALDIDRLARRLRGGFDVVYLANPANPTGAVTPKEVVLEAARAAASSGAVLVVDEAFADFSEGSSIKDEATGFKNVIVLRSMTKFYSLAGLRLGFMVANRSMVERFSRLAPPWTVNTPAARAGVEALRDTAFASRTRAWLERERGFLARALGSIQGLKPYPSAANFLMVRIEKGGASRPVDASGGHEVRTRVAGLTAGALRRALLREGILIRDLSAFKGLGRRYFRVAVKGRQANRLLVDALRRALSGRP